MGLVGRISKSICFKQQVSCFGGLLSFQRPKWISSCTRRAQLLTPHLLPAPETHAVTRERRIQPVPNAHSYQNRVNVIISIHANVANVEFAFSRKHKHVLTKYFHLCKDFHRCNELQNVLTLLVNAHPHTHTRSRARTWLRQSPKQPKGNQGA